MSYKPDRHNIFLLLIMIVGAILRLYQFDNWSLSNDELSALNRLQFENLADLIQFGVKENDFHPAGVQLFLYFWTNIFGLSEFWVRIPFVSMGIVSVYITYLIGKQWFNRSSGLIAALMMATLEFVVLYSQLARPYSPGLLFCLLSVYYWTRILFNIRPHYTEYIAYVIFTTMAAYTHNYAFLFVLMVGGTGLFLTQRANIWKYLLCGLSAFLLYLPHIPVFLYQFSIGGIGGPEGWLGVPEQDFLFSFLLFVFNDNYYIIILFILALSLLYFLNPKKKGITLFQKLSFLFFVLPYAIAYYYSIYRNPILQYSILLFSLPFLFLFLSSIIGSFKTMWSYLVIGLLLMVLVMDILVWNKFYEKQHFGEFKGVAQTLKAFYAEKGKENIDAAISVNGPYYIDYYLDKMDYPITFTQYDNRGGEDLRDLNSLLSRSNKDYFVYAWTKPVVREIDEIIQFYFPCVVGRKDFSGLSAVTLYARYGEACIEEKILLESAVADWDTLTASESFSKGITIQVAEVGINQDDELILSASIKLNELDGNTLLAYSIQDTSNNTLLWEASLAEDFIFDGNESMVVCRRKIDVDLSSGDYLKAYIWNKSGKTVYYKNMELSKISH